MCLIIYAPDATLPTRDQFTDAGQCNPDGIGVMSSDGVVKFNGRKKTRRAWRYIRTLADAGIPYAVHFRWATHGRVSASNTHPFEIPGHNAYMMHNGILWTSAVATESDSDTAIFARSIAPDILGRPGWQHDMGHEANGNRLLFMLADGTFEIINRSLWTRHAGIWFSNTYSCDIPLPPTGKAGSKSREALSLASYASKRSYPSGPTLRWTGHGYQSDDDYGYDYADAYNTVPADIAEVRAIEDSEYLSGIWQDEYQSAILAGYSREEASTIADGQALKVTGAVREEKTGRKSASGFDWHNPETWKHYPIPGSLPKPQPEQPAAHDIAADGTVRPSIKYV